MSVVPGQAVFISNTAVMALLHACMQGSSGGDAARAGTVGAVEPDSTGGESVEIRCFNVGMTRIAQTVRTKLIGHNKYDIRLCHNDHSFVCYVITTIIQEQTKSNRKSKRYKIVVAIYKIVFK